MTEMESGIIEALQGDHSALAIPEVMDELREKGYSVDGDFGIASGKCEHVLYWTGMSKEFIQALESLRKTGKIEYTPMSAFEAFLTGHILRLPMVRANRQYKRDHWLPVWLQLVQC